jgi:hypothetical protein
MEREYRFTMPPVRHGDPSLKWEVVEILELRTPAELQNLRTQRQAITSGVTT